MLKSPVRKGASSNLVLIRNVLDVLAVANEFGNDFGGRRRRGGGFFFFLRRRRGGGKGTRACGCV
jgi:hypothetical protein